MTRAQPPADSDVLRGRLRLHRRLNAALLAAVVAQAYFLAARWSRENPEQSGLTAVARQAPRAREVKKVLEKLRYSGLPALRRPEVSLRVDFPTRRWTLRNMHMFDPSGQALLDGGRFGACGQLAIYAHQRIQPLFDHRYRIRIVLAAESGFFPPPRSTHYVLKISDVSDPFRVRDYILDPAFRRYGPLADFDDYVLYQEVGFLSFVRERGRDETHPVNGGTPLLIRNQSMLGFSVRETEGKLDADNYTLALSLTRKHKYYSRPLLLIQKKDGKTAILEDKSLLKDILSDEDYEALKSRLYQLFQGAAPAA
jgi:hypothetical protein